VQRLRHTVETIPPRLSNDHIEAVWEVAHSEDTWILPAPRA
jgi:hypothetical protein